jgi:hypothetical protein
VAVIAVIMIGAIEILQFWAPERHARLEDFVIDALTACVGLAVAAGLDWAMQRLRSISNATCPFNATGAPRGFGQCGQIAHRADFRSALRKDL